jgi:hypothetical protein
MISSVAFACLLAGTLLGVLLQRVLPEHHFSGDSKSLINLGMGLIGTMAALALGLILASAKGSYDTTRSELIQLAANFGLLDRALAHYGPETRETRVFLRRSLEQITDVLWARNGAAFEQSDPTATGFGMVSDQIEALAPQNDSQRTIQSHSLDITVDIGRTIWLLHERRGRSISTPLVVMLIFWFVIIFTSFGLFAPRHTTAFVVLFLCALSVSAALFLILELDRLFGGLIQIPSAPLCATAEQIGK